MLFWCKISWKFLEGNLSRKFLEGNFWREIKVGNFGGKYDVFGVKVVGYPKLT